MSHSNLANNSPKTDEQKQAILAKVQLPDDWKQALSDMLTSATMDELRDFLKQQYAQGKTIYPPPSLIFNALNHTSLNQVKVVVLGQDPYHGAGQAMGLSFSVPKGITKPPSLQNILQELATDVGVRPPNHGDLTAWANRGVLLLNSVLTVEAGQPTSHKNQGWEAFTDAVIETVNQHKQHCVFILWGAYAQKKGSFIDQNKHLVLKAVHPSPLAANRGGFFGSQPFSKTNDYLVQHGKTAINWQL